jgi:hypothetical protein
LTKPQIALGLCLIAGLAVGAELAVIPVSPARRQEAAQLGIPCYWNGGDFLLVPLAAELSQDLRRRGWQYETLESELHPGEYFIIFKAGPGRRALPGNVLWQNERCALARLGEAEAGVAKAQNYEMVRLPAGPHRLSPAPAGGLAPPPDTLIQRLVNQVSLDSLRRTILDLENYGTRYTYSRKCDTAAWYLERRLADLSLATESDTYLCGTQHDVSYNVIATIPGQVHPESIVIACGHFDSYSDEPATLAPGADDNASGTAAVLEAARILAAAQSRLTLKFIAFSGEEQWMVGSYHWVDSVAAPRQLKIAGVYNVDMIAYTAFDSNLLFVNTNTASRSLAVLAESANAQYRIGLRLINYLDEDCAGDNLPFWEHGIKAVFALEDSEYGIWNGSNPYYHTTHDTLGNIRMGQVKRGAQLTVACLAALAGVYSPSGADEPFTNHEPQKAGRKLTVTPNPFTRFATAPGHEREQFVLYGASGRTCGIHSGGRIGAGLAPGVYFIRAPAGGASAARIVKL